MVSEVWPMMRKIQVAMLAVALTAMGHSVVAQEEEESWAESQEYIGSGFRLCGLDFLGVTISPDDLTGYCFAGAGFVVPESGRYQITIKDEYSDTVYGFYGYCTAEGECPDIPFDFCNTITTRYHGAGDSLAIWVLDPVSGTEVCGEVTTPLQGTISIKLVD